MMPKCSVFQVTRTQLINIGSIWAFKNQAIRNGNVLRYILINFATF